MPAFAEKHAIEYFVTSHSPYLNLKIFSKIVTLVLGISIVEVGGGLEAGMVNKKHSQQNF